MRMMFYILSTYERESQNTLIYIIMVLFFQNVNFLIFHHAKKAFEKVHSVFPPLSITLLFSLYNRHSADVDIVRIKTNNEES